MCMCVGCVPVCRVCVRVFVYSVCLRVVGSVCILIECVDCWCLRMCSGCVLVCIRAVVCVFHRVNVDMCADSCDVYLHRVLIDVHVHMKSFVLVCAGACVCAPT